MDITLASITTIANEPMFRTYIIGMQKSYAWSEGTNQIWTSHIPVSGMESCCSFQMYFSHSSRCIFPTHWQHIAGLVSCKLTSISELLKCKKSLFIENDSVNQILHSQGIGTVIWHT